MGTDIHGVFQRRNESTGEWIFISHNYEMERHYLLFAVLANVCNGYGFVSTTPISEQRGYPEGFPVIEDQVVIPIEVSTTEYAAGGWYYMGDRSHSWLTSSEMVDWLDKAEYTIKADLGYFFDEVRRLHTLHGEVRFVFGFDS